jgi:hypothetical protein
MAEERELKRLAGRQMIKFHVFYHAPGVAWDGKWYDATQHREEIKAKSRCGLGRANAASPVRAYRELQEGRS